MADQAVATTTIAERLRSARVRAGLTQRGLSRAAELSPTYVGMVERSQRVDPQAQSLAKLAKALGVRVEWLITGEGG